MKQLPREIIEVIDNIIEDMSERPFAKTWGTEEKNMRKILEKHLLPQEQEAKPQIEIKKAHKTKDKWWRFYGNCPSCRNRICISMDIW